MTSVKVPHTCWEGGVLGGFSMALVKNGNLGGGNSYIFYFSLGEDEPILTTNIFQLGVFNHHLESGSLLNHQ